MYDYTKVKNTKESKIDHSFSKSVTINIEQRQWILKFTALKSIRSEIENLIPILVLIKGSLYLLCRFSYFVQGSKPSTQTIH